MATETQNGQEAGGFWKLFGPASFLLNRLRYSYKFTLIGVVLLVPFAFLLQLQYAASGFSKEFNAKEVDGVEYIRPVREFMFAIEKRRVLAAAVAAGESSLSGQIPAVTAEADDKIKDIDAVDAKLGVRLKASDKWKTLKSEWATLKSFAPSDPAAADEAHAKVTAIAVDLILNDIGNASNLILDPDLDSYWLMDAYIIKLPLLGETTAKLANQAMTPGVMDADRQLALGGSLFVATGTAADLVNINLTTAIKESSNPAFGLSPTLRPNLEGPGKDLRGTVDDFAALMKEQAALEARDPKAIAESALKTLNETSSFYAKVEPELEWLCQKRADRYGATQTLGLVVGLVAVVLLAYIFVGFYLAVRGSVVALGAAARRMIAGVEEPVQTDNRDEIVEIVDAFNQINVALVESRALQRTVQASNQLLQDNILDLLRVVSDASDGDLRVRAKVTEGSLGNVADAFNQLLESLNDLIGAIKKQLDRTLGSISDISKASTKMADGASAQADEVVAATRLVQAMRGEIQRVSESAQVAADTAKRTEESALRGTEGVQEAIQGMASLRGNVQAGAKKMKSLGDRSMEITGIVGTINRISEQTDMLALNAAIEAARAGEHGRGFTVVAEEVRKLAERTATATQEIDKLVKTIHSETSETVLAIEQQTQFVEKEAAVVGKTGESLVQIREVSTQSATLVTNISSVALAQVQESARVVNTMTSISEIAQRTKETAEGTTAIVAELRQLSEDLAKSIQRFKLA